MSPLSLDISIHYHGLSVEQHFVFPIPDRVRIYSSLPLPTRILLAKNSQYRWTPHNTLHKATGRAILRCFSSIIRYPGQRVSRNIANVCDE